MWYRFERDYAITYECIVEADSLEEAKQKAEDNDDIWNENDDQYSVRYWGYKLNEEEAKNCYEKDELTQDDVCRVDGDMWDELPEDKDFFNHLK